MSQNIPVIDPHRLPIITATGPTIVWISPETFVITFSQMVPPVEGSSNKMEAVAVARIAMNRSKLENLVKQLQLQQLA